MAQWKLIKSYPLILAYIEQLGLYALYIMRGNFHINNEVYKSLQIFICLSYPIKILI